MSKSMQEIAQQLKDCKKKVQLIYAFNGTGKTRLSRAMKDLIAPKVDDGLSRLKFLYYSAFTEDLFYWDNDLESDLEPRLKIQRNPFTQWILEDQGQDQNIITHFQRYTNDKLTPHFSENFSEITFSLERGDDTQSGKIKTSKGEESNFVWSVFHALLEQTITTLNIADPADRETSQFDQLEYVFIDDPVSSLDENHLIQLAVDLAKLIKSTKSRVKFIISTHNPLFYNVLYNELSLKNGYILSRLDDGTFELSSKKGDSNNSFSYHLHIKSIIEKAIEENNLQRYHFMLLRNLYEKTANFLGYPTWSDLLPAPQENYATRIMNFYSHKTLSHEEVAEPTTPEKAMISLLLTNLNRYCDWQ